MDCVKASTHAWFVAGSLLCWHHVRAGRVVRGQEAGNSGAVSSLRTCHLRRSLRPSSASEGFSASLQILLALDRADPGAGHHPNDNKFPSVCSSCLLFCVRLWGTQQLPPSQVITALAFFVTLAASWPRFGRKPTFRRSSLIRNKNCPQKRGERGAPVRRFMSLQIERAGNSEDVWLFLRYTQPHTEPTTYEEVPSRLSRLYAQRIEDGFLDRFSDLPAL